MIRIINLACIYFLTCCLQASTKADSQKTNLNVKNKALYKIFQEAEQNPGYSLSILSSSKIKRVLKVPSQYATISEAVLNANTGDTVIISPGSYIEKNIKLNKAIIISSEWKLTGDKSIIEKTSVDAADSNLFTINANGVEISGLRIVNGDHGIRAFAKSKIIYNHLVNSKNDAISLESGGGGYIAYNLIENSHDDGIDIDIGEIPDNIGSDVTVEYNTIINSRDDGMEIRLFTSPNQNIHYEIKHNIFLDSRNAGIQLISYDVNSGKVFNIHHNIFKGCKTALGCMEGAKTREDLNGASKMDERVYFYNNTITENKMAATGGNNIIAANNIVDNNTLGGFKRFGKNSVIINNLFFKNNNTDLIEISPFVIKKNNLFNKDPLMDKNIFTLDAKSPAINYGIKKLVLNKKTLFAISADLFTGTSPDLGVVEINNNKYPGSPLSGKVFRVDAGENISLTHPQNTLTLRGKIESNSSDKIDCLWSLHEGPSIVRIAHPRELTTDVQFFKTGIYEFSLLGSDNNANVSAKDQVTVRYINSGEGKQHYINRYPVTIEAEDFSYSYGQKDEVSTSGKPSIKYILLNEESQSPSLEFILETGQSSKYYLWARVKSISDKSQLSFEFNKKDVGNVFIDSNKKYKWIKFSGNISVSGGQWSLFIKNIKGKTYIDKILLTRDSSFVPR